MAPLDCEALDCVALEFEAVDALGAETALELAAVSSLGLDADSAGAVITVFTLLPTGPLGLRTYPHIQPTNNANAMTIIVKMVIQ